MLTRSSVEKREDNYWLAPDSGGEKQFILDLHKQRLINTILLVNIHNADSNDRSTKEFKVLLSNFPSGPWREVLHETLEDSSQMTDPLPLLEFPITPTVGRYVKFSLLSFYGLGGGLNYFAVRSGIGISISTYYLLIDMINISI